MRSPAGRILTKAAAIKWVQHCIRVNALMPGTIKTPLLEECIRQQPDYAKVIMKSTPSGALVSSRKSSVSP
jgi:NAD(P)-dependent dehydrogenase (short-subunit alcohol dehydrogenase family)